MKNFLRYALPSDEQRAHMTTGEKNKRRLIFFLVMCLVAGLIYFVINTSAKSQPESSPAIVLTSFYCSTGSGPCSPTYGHRAARFRNGKYGRGHGFHATTWMTHPKRERARFVSFVVQHPKSVPARFRGSKNANAAWSRTLKNATCVWPGEYTRLRKDTRDKIACTGVHAVGHPNLWTKKNWRILGFTICEGLIAFSMRRAGSRDSVAFGAGSVPCMFGAVSDSVQNKLVASP